MREIIIERLRRFECSGMALRVTLNGEKQGKLKNGQQLSLTAEDGAVELQVCGGFLTGKSFRDTVYLPAGTQNYRFRVDFASTGGGYQSVLRPCSGLDLREDPRLVLLLGAELTRLLLDEKFQAGMRKLNDTHLRLTLQPDAWRLVLADGKAIYTGQFADAHAGFAGAVTTLMERAALKDPEKQREFVTRLVAEYACALPQYQQTGEDEFTFVG